MNFVRLLPVILSFLILAAHFSRAEGLVMAAFCLIIPLLLFYRNRWVPRIMQLFLVLAAFEWIRTTLLLVSERQAQGQPWLRMGIILGGVAVFTLLSVLIFKNKKLALRYRKDKN